MVRSITIPFILFFLSSQTFAADCGQFKVVKGKVTYKQSGQKKFRKARINKKVCQGDMVKTESDARAKIIMADQNEINISPETELLIEVYQKDKKAVLNVLNGKVRSNVKKKYDDNENSHYRVKTKSAVAGVRGTEFLASFSRQTNESRVVTFEGVVNVGRLQGGNIVGSVLVKPGQFTSNKLGQNPHPAQEVPTQELSLMDQDTNLSDSPRDVSSDAGDTSDARTPDSVDNEQETDTGADDKGNPPPANKENNQTRQPNSVRENHKLPPPELPKDIGNGGSITPPAPVLNELPPPPIVDNVCLTCNDAIINQKVKLIIVPKLPGQ